MTDLERRWDEMPTPPPPTEAILRAGRRAEMIDESAVVAADDAVRGADRRRRFVVRPLLTAVAATAVIGAFVAGSLVSDGDGSGGGGMTPPGPSPVAFAADLEPAGSCDDLLAHYVDRGLGLVTAWGWSRISPVELQYLLGGSDLGSIAAADQLSASRVEKAPGTERQVNSETGTNVQEEGVDEPDTVKTDGELLLRLRGNDLTVYELADAARGDDGGDGSGPLGATVRVAGSLRLDSLDDPEMLLSGDTVIAVGADATSPRDDLGNRTGTRVVTVDISNPTTPTVVEEVGYDAANLSLRQHGSTVRLVLSAGLPELDFVTPRGRSRARALEHNRSVVEQSTIEDWLPSYTVGDGEPETLLDCTDVALTPDEMGLDTVAVVGFDAASPGEVDAIGLTGATEIAYESDDHLYLAASPGWDDWTMASRVAFPVGPAPVAGGTSYLFDFRLDGPRATHVASGEVEGAIRDRWAMDEADGVLRVAVGPTEETGDFNAVVSFERQGQDLVELGRLNGLGVREDIKAVRWFDDLAIVVTFRQVDPLYAIDLTDDAAPRMLGKLKIPGFSSYLHPMGSMRMIGLGEGPSGDGWGAQMGLFDVTDLTEPRRLDVHSYGRRTTPLAATDPRAFTWVPEHRTVLTVIEQWGRTRLGLLSVTRIVKGQLEESSTRVEYGPDVDQVRTVPVGDGQVVLVTGEQVRYLELD